MKRIVVVLCLVIAVVSCQKKEEPKMQYRPPLTGAMPDNVQVLQDVVKKDQGNVKAWVELGNTFMDGKRFSEAIDAYGKALEIDPKNVDVRVDMGSCYRSIGRPDMAEKEYRKALEINPRHAIGHRNLGIVLAYDFNKKDQAIKEFEKYLQLSPNAPDADKVRHLIASLKALK
jgi:tetratricopeptide (TPR) repeat protein